MVLWLLGHLIPGLAPWAWSFYILRTGSQPAWMHSQEWLCHR